MLALSHTIIFVIVTGYVLKHWRPFTWKK